MADSPGHATLQAGDRVVCLGDSITADPHGYVTLAQQVLSRVRPGAEIVNAGVAGHTAADMAARFGGDVVAQQPTWVTISAGGNDAARGVALADYERAVLAMVREAQSAGIAVGLCTPTPVEPGPAGAPANAINALVARYAKWVEQAAEELGLLLIPMHAVFRLVQTTTDPADPVRLTHDGVHMSPSGRYLMGLTFLAAFGISLEPNLN